MSTVNAYCARFADTRYALLVSLKYTHVQFKTERRGSGDENPDYRKSLVLCAANTNRINNPIGLYYRSPEYEENIQCNICDLSLSFLSSN